MAVEYRVQQSEVEQRLSVLLVDCDVSAREAACLALGERYTVRMATGAREALDAIERERPDLLITEVDLADGDGLALCEQLRALPATAQLPILLLTQRSSIRDKVAGFQAGADDYVVKPLDARLFSARLRLLCRLKLLERPRDRSA